MVKIAYLGNSCTFHFCAVACKSISKPFLLLFIRNELVSGNNSSCKYADLRVYFFAALFCKSDHFLICLKRKCVYSWDLSWLIAKCLGIHIML